MEQKFNPEDKDMSALVFSQIVAGAEPPDPMVCCPACGWQALIHKTWHTGVRFARSYHCLKCEWGQSGTC